MSKATSLPTFGSLPGNACMLQVKPENIWPSCDVRRCKGGSMWGINFGPHFPALARSVSCCTGHIRTSLASLIAGMHTSGACPRFCKRMYISPDFMPSIWSNQHFPSSSAVKTTDLNLGCASSSSLPRCGPLPTITSPLQNVNGPGSDLALTKTGTSDNGFSAGWGWTCGAGASGVLLNTLHPCQSKTPKKMAALAVHTKTSHENFFCSFMQLPFQEKMSTCTGN